MNKDQTLICISGITTPNYPDPYNENEDKKWVIEAPVGQVIKFDFITFAIEDHISCKWDWVEVIDGKGYPLLKRSCGFIKPESFISHSDRAIVRFHSDDSISEMGFELKYSFIVKQFL